MDAKKIAQILRAVKDEGRNVLLDTEGLQLLQAMDLPIPRFHFVRSPAEAEKADLSALGGDQVVIKVVSPDILHKTDVGGVQIVRNDRQTVVSTVAQMEKKFKSSRLVGFTINQFVKYNSSLGRELLFGMRWTADFGPIVTFGSGGIYAEFLAKNFKPGRDVAIRSPQVPADLEQAARQMAISEIITGRYRNQEPLVPFEQVVELASRFLSVAPKLMHEGVSEFEVNPFVLTPDKKIVALDVLIKLKSGETAAAANRPVHKIRNLLEPRSVAIIGVSEKLNPGHIILNNLIRYGFDKSKIYIVKPNAEQIEGCRCVPDVNSLPEKVDLFILSVSATQVPEIVTDIIEYQKAESLIVIPGGLEEKKGTEALVAGMHAALRESRKTEWGGPVINGGNCLGIRSVPGHYNTLFIPEQKLPIPSDQPSRLALVSQSGAFAISRISKLAALNPRYTISIGNQMDLTIGDYLTFLKEDPELDIFAVYVEGFKELDGLRFLQAAHEIRQKGKTVILYRAGRTSAGAAASASHTASIAGDYAVTRELCQAAGIVLAEDLEEFEDLMKVFTFLGNRRPNGNRLGAVSNAGCECVAIADNLGDLELARLSKTTFEKLQGVLKRSGISEIVDVHNPLDLTPMANDAAYDESFRHILEDPSVDLGIFGLVPLSAALNTLPAGSGRDEDILSDSSVATRLIRVMGESQKPWVAVVDAGEVYDPLVKRLESHRIATFRTADRALKRLNVYYRAKRRSS